MTPAVDSFWKVSFHIRVNNFPCALQARQSSNCTLNNQEVSVRIPYLTHSSNFVGKEISMKIAPDYKLCSTLLGLIQSLFSESPSLFPLHVQLSFFSCVGKCTNGISGLLSTYHVSDSWDINRFVVFLLSCFHSDYNWKTITNVDHTWPTAEWGWYKNFNYKLC